MLSVSVATWPSGPLASRGAALQQHLVPVVGVQVEEVEDLRGARHAGVVVAGLVLRPRRHVGVADDQQRPAGRDGGGG